MIFPVLPDKHALIHLIIVVLPDASAKKNSGVVFAACHPAAESKMGV
jgi:hypothetical protein